MVQTTSREEIQQAAAAGGVSAISVVGKTVEEAVELQQYIPESVSGGQAFFLKRGLFFRVPWMKDEAPSPDVFGIRWKRTVCMT